MAQELKGKEIKTIKYKNMATPYKMKGSPMQRNFKVGSPMKNKELTKAEKQANLLKAVPNKEAYDKLSDANKKGFDKAGKIVGLPQKPA